MYMKWRQVMQDIFALQRILNSFLGKAKTGRRRTARMWRRKRSARAIGLFRFGTKLAPGDKVYYNNRGKEYLSDPGGKTGCIRGWHPSIVGVSTSTARGSI